MKKLLSFTIALLFSAMLFAQNNIILQESFNGSALPDGWQETGNTSSNWSVSASNNAGGNANELKLNCQPSFSGISRMTTAAVDLTNVPGVIVSFKMYFDNFSTTTNNIYIATSSDNGNTWNQGWSKGYNTTGKYTEEINIVTSDMGKSNVIFGIYYNGEWYDFDAWYFDDIVITAQESTDLKMVSIDVPNMLGAGNTEIPFTVKNLGCNKVQSFTASYEIEGYGKITETFNTSLNSFDQAGFTFQAPTFLIPGSYNVEVNIIDVNGISENSTNNTMEKDFAIALGQAQRIPMIEHFSSSTCAPCVNVNQHMADFTANNPGKYTYTKYPVDFPGMGDPYANDDSKTRENYYVVNGVPDIYLDGRQTATMMTQATLDERYNTPAFADIRGSFTTSGKVITITADVTSYVNLSNARLFVSVNEKITTENASSNGEEEFRHIMMKMLDSAEGNTFAIAAGQTKSFEYTYNLFNSNVEQMSDLEVAMWIQDYDTKEVFNSHYLYEYTSHPYTVSDIIAEQDGDEMTIRWEAPQQAEPSGYHLYVNGELLLEKTNETSHSIAITEDLYIIEVVALYGEKTSVAKIHKVNTDVDAPENLQVNALETSFKINWSAVDGATAYQLYRRGEFLLETTSTSYNDGCIQLGMEFCYRVRTIKGDKISAFTPEACAIIEVDDPCFAPTELGATIEQDAEGFDHNFKVTMTWDAVDNAQEYSIYLDGNKLETTTETSYVKGFDEEGSHYFTVVTHCEVGESLPSSPYEFEIKGEAIEEMENTFEIYPNPVDDVLYIKLNEEVKEINIYNIYGIKMATVNGQQSAVSVNLSTFNSGIYFIEIEGNVYRIIRN